MQLNPFSRVARKRRAERKILRQRRHGISRRLATITDHHFVVHYAKNPHSQLSGLCEKHDADKGGVQTNPRKMPLHNYADFYEMIFGGMRMQVANVLECGIGRGGSLRAWQEYFPNAQITGIDIDETQLFADERIETHQVDQTDPASIAEFLAQVNNRKFDIIIDDGLHTYESGVTFFDNIIDNLTDGGIYIIEDLPSDLFCKMMKLFSKNPAYYAQGIVLNRPNKFRHDNALIMLTKNKGAA